MRTHLPLYTYLILNPILPCPTLLQLKHTLTLHILTTLLLLRPLAPTFALALAIPTPYNIQQQYPTPAHIPSPQAPSHYSSLQEVQDLSKIIAFEAWTNAISEKMSGYNYYRVGNVRGKTSKASQSYLFFILFLVIRIRLRTCLNRNVSRGFSLHLLLLLLFFPRTMLCFESNQQYNSCITLLLAYSFSA